MRSLLAIASALCLLPVVGRAENPRSAPPAGITSSTPEGQHPKSCAADSAKECGPSKKDRKKAREVFEHGLRLKNTRPQEALDSFTAAVHLVPNDPQYVSTRELFLQQLVYEHTQRGNQLLAQGETGRASAEFLAALKLDSGNRFAAERLIDVSDAPLAARPRYIEPQADPPGTLRPKPGQQSLHLRTDTRGAYNTIGSAFDIKVKCDSSTPATSIHLDLDQVTFEQAMEAVALVTHTFWTPVSPSEVLIAADTPSKRKEFERWLLRTFYLPETSSPQELNDIATLLQNLFDLPKVTKSAASGTLTVRGPAAAVLGATQFLQTLRPERPQVMIDFEVYQITREALRDAGINLPQNFSMFPFSQPALSITASGTTSPPSALQNSASLLPNSIITFGGGKTMMGIQVPAATAQFSQTYSRAISLSRVSMRGSQGKATTFRLGTRYPVITSLFATNTPTLGNLPQVTYEDLGITIKVTPTIHKQDVTLDLQMEMNSLGSQLFNGIPSISSRRYSGTITVPKDEAAIVAGSVSQTEIKSLSGIPGISHLPVLGRVVSAQNREHGEDELVVIVTPHVTADAQYDTSTELVVPRN